MSLIWADDDNKSVAHSCGMGRRSCCNITLRWQPDHESDSAEQPLLHPADLAQNSPLLKHFDGLRHQERYLQWHFTRHRGRDSNHAYPWFLRYDHSARVAGSTRNRCRRLH